MIDGFVSTRSRSQPDSPPAPVPDGNAGTPVIRASNIWKIFGPKPDRIIGTPDADLSRSELRAKTGCVAAVRDVSLEVWPGEVFVVMGLSGSGKSTLVRTLIRLIEPTAGSDRDRRTGRDRSQRRRAARAAAQQRLDDLPALRPARPPSRDRQRCVRARDPRSRQVRAAGQGTGDAPPRRARGGRELVPGPALGRDAAARRRRARVRRATRP